MLEEMHWIKLAMILNSAKLTGLGCLINNRPCQDLLISYLLCYILRTPYSEYVLVTSTEETNSLYSKNNSANSFMDFEASEDVMADNKYYK